MAGNEELPLHALTARFGLGRTGVAKHLAVLRAAGLVEGRRVGRETRYRLEALPLREVRDWVGFYEQFWTRRVERLREVLEEDDDA